MALGMGADVIGIDARAPANMGPNFLEGDISTPAGAAVEELQREVTSKASGE